MKFMIIVKATPDSEGIMPQKELMAEMAAYHGQLAEAGQLVDGSQPSSKGWRIYSSGNEHSCINGPFRETNELIAGYSIIKVRSVQEALEWSKKYPNPAGNGKTGEIEVRRLFELDDFEPGKAVERFRTLEKTSGGDFLMNGGNT